MKTKPARTAPHLAAFISHASKDSRWASRLVDSLKADGLPPWIDHSDVRFGQLLRNELTSAIQASRVLVLVWSKAASASRWVIAEVLTAFHLDHFIVPCVLDATPLPQFLQNAAYLDRKRDKTQLGSKLSHAIRTAPEHANEIPALLAMAGPHLQQTIEAIARTQQQELQALQDGQMGQARKLHRSVDVNMKAALRAYRFEPMILNLMGYHQKNGYMLKHWAAIQAGRAPRDPLLIRAERYFFESLGVQPMDASALNGLGSILMFERELDAAEFFQRRAIAVMKRAGRKYPEAQHDLDLVLYFKRKQVDPSA